MAQLPELVADARAANRQNDITEMLVYDGRNYLHVVEGPRRRVDTLMANILMDDRHSKLRILADTRTPTRWYLEFSGGLLNSPEECRLISRLVRNDAALAFDVYRLCVGRRE